MKTYKYKNREEYLSTQTVRSQQKATYCKVYFSDVIRYKSLLTMDAQTRRLRGLKTSNWSPILCLGVRTGAEVDIFRSVFLGPLLKFAPVQRFAIKQDKTAIGQNKIDLAKRIGLGSGSRKAQRVMGVELNPLAQREDVFVGSFDEMPKEWAGKFQIIYSNSFDHVQDPYQTVAEWKRVAGPGAYVIIAFTHLQAQSDHDPLSGITFSSLIELWQAPVVFSTETLNQNGYHEVCFKLD